MRKLEASYEILTEIDGNEELKRIESAARVCYKSEDKVTDTSSYKLVRNLIKSGHLAMLEHSQLSIKFTVDRGVSHELVRHRLCSYAQSSTRYCNYSNAKYGSEIQVIDLANGIKVEGKLTENQQVEVLKEWLKAMESAEKSYLSLIGMGASPQIARSVLPNSTMTEVIMTANYREWRAILQLRADSPSHPQMREVMVPLLAELKGRIPVIFDDILID